MKKEVNFIMRFRRNLIIWEIVKCIIWSIFVAMLVSVPIVLQEDIHKLFFVLVPVMIFSFSFFYFFISRIKKINKNIIYRAREYLKKKIRVLEEKEIEIIKKIDACKKQFNEVTLLW